MTVIVAVCLRSPRPRWNLTPCLGAKNGFENYSGTVSAFCDNFMSWHERERREGLKISRRSAVNSGQIGPADPCQASGDVFPARSGQIRRIEFGEPQRTE